MTTDKTSQDNVGLFADKLVCLENKLASISREYKAIFYSKKIWCEFSINKKLVSFLDDISQETENARIEFANLLQVFCGDKQTKPLKLYDEFVLISEHNKKYYIANMEEFIYQIKTKHSKPNNPNI